jgi:hypothetical protein
MRAEQSRNALIDYLSTGVAESWAFEDLLLLAKRRSEITGKDFARSTPEWSANEK